MRNLSIALHAGFCVIALALSRADAALEFAPVVLTGRPVEGAGPGVQYSGGFAPPLNVQQQMIFPVKFQGANVTPGVSAL